MGTMKKLPFAGAKSGISRGLAFDSEILALGCEDKLLRLYFWRDAVREAMEAEEEKKKITQSNFNFVQFPVAVSAVSLSKG